MPKKFICHVTFDAITTNILGNCTFYFCVMYRLVNQITFITPTWL